MSDNCKTINYLNNHECAILNVELLQAEIEKLKGFQNQVPILMAEIKRFKKSLKALVPYSYKLFTYMEKIEPWEEGEDPLDKPAYDGYNYIVQAELLLEKLKNK